MPYYYFDYSYIIYVLPAIIFALYAQAKVKSAFSKYQNVSASYGLSGFDVARRLLDSAGLNEVPVEMTPGSLTDHYDPKSKVLRLSESVYSSRSIAAVGVAAHETGHAVQHAEGYFPLILRNNLYPIANFGSTLTWPLVILGLIMGLPMLVNIGIILFTAAVLFQVITLPVELNASRRAVVLLENQGLITTQERKPVKTVLSAAAMTYVAATIVALGNLLRLLALRDRNS